MVYTARHREGGGGWPKGQTPNGACSFKRWALGSALGVTADRLEHQARAWIGDEMRDATFRNAVRQYIARLEDHVGDAVLLRDALNEMEVGTISEE